LAPGLWAATTTPEAWVDDGRRMNEAKLREKLSKIEALFAGAATEGECVAVGEARRRIQQRLASVERLDPPVEFRFSLPDT
jgi:hypothetical protein